MIEATEAKPQIFTVWSDEVEKRLDPLYYSSGNIYSFLQHLNYPVSTIA